MKAVFLPGNKKVEIRSVKVPRAGPGEVLIAVKASCICRSDLSLYYGNAVLAGKAGQCISGHEPAGLVVETGTGVLSVRVGDRVAVSLAVGCGFCPFCRSGNLHLCREWKCLGFTADGGNAEYLVVPERNCHPIPDSMSFLTAAMSTDAFGTLYSACKKLQITGVSRVGIWGLGPMGSAGVLAAKALGGRVVALDPLQQRRDFALELGADLALDPAAPDALAKIEEFTDGLGLGAALDCSGSPVAQNMALDATAPLGRVALIGESRETTIRPSDQLIRKQIVLMGSWYFNVAEYDEIARTLTEQKIDLEKLATHTFGLQEAETAFRMFDERKTEKVVFIM